MDITGALVVKSDFLGARAGFVFFQLPTDLYLYCHRDHNMMSTDHEQRITALK